MLNVGLFFPPQNSAFLSDSIFTFLGLALKFLLWFKVFYLIVTWNRNFSKMFTYNLFLSLSLFIFLSLFLSLSLCLSFFLSLSIYSSPSVSHFLSPILSLSLLLSVHLFISSICLSIYLWYQHIHSCLSGVYILNLQSNATIWDSFFHFMTWSWTSDGPYLCLLYRMEI